MSPLAIFSSHLPKDSQENGWMCKLNCKLHPIDSDSYVFPWNMPSGCSSLRVYLVFSYSKGHLSTLEPPQAPSDTQHRSCSLTAKRWHTAIVFSDAILPSSSSSQETSSYISWVKKQHSNHSQQAFRDVGEDHQLMEGEPLLFYSIFSLYWTLTFLSGCDIPGQYLPLLNPGICESFNSNSEEVNRRKVNLKWWSSQFRRAASYCCICNTPARPTRVIPHAGTCNLAKIKTAQVGIFHIIYWSLVGIKDHFRKISCFQ